MKKINIKEIKNLISRESFMVKSSVYGRDVILSNTIFEYLEQKESESEECCEKCENWTESCMELSEKFGMCFIDENRLGEYIYYDDIADKLLFRKDYHCNHWRKENKRKNQ